MYTHTDTQTHTYTYIYSVCVCVCVYKCCRTCWSLLKGLFNVCLLTFSMSITDAWFKNLFLIHWTHICSPHYCPPSFSPDLGKSCHGDGQHCRRVTGLRMQGQIPVHPTGQDILQRERCQCHPVICSHSWPLIRDEPGLEWHTQEALEGKHEMMFPRGPTPDDPWYWWRAEDPKPSL